ncbi:MAG: AMP-binding protein [Planctomycetota bacterium]|nr:AMP-binding protein [Planctomycetota bacterium]
MGTEADGQEQLWRAFIAQARAGEGGEFQQHWEAFTSIYAGREERDGPPPAWFPEPAQVAGSNLGRFMAQLGIGDYAALFAWSVRERAAFWQKALARLGIVFAREPEAILDASGGVEDPRWLPGALMNCVDSCFRQPADKPAIVSGREGSDERRTVTYAELEQLAGRFAAGLVRHGFAPGDALALYMPMTVECVAAYLGIVRAGCVVISIADSFPPAELQKRFEIGGGAAILTVESFERAGRSIELYAKVREAGAPRAIVIPSEGGAAPDLRDGDLLWEDFLGDAPPASASIAADPYAVTNILFSSGTTGTPKAIPWTHLAPLKCAVDGHFHQDLGGDDVVAWPTNIGWMMGPWLIYAALMNGGTIALYEGVPTGAGFGRFVRDAGVTMLGVVPSLVRAWRTAGALEGIQWDGVRVFSSTGEPSNRYDYLWLMSRAAYRAPVIEYCGGTEIGGGYITGTVVQPASPATFTTPALGLDLVILGESGNPAPVGEPGEVFLQPPSIGLSQTLLNRDHHEVYYAGTPAGPDGALLRRHGDRIVRMHAGFFKAQGRADDTMNLGGIKVGSLELERVLNTHPGVYETAAVGVQPEGEGAERLVVYAVVRGSVDPDSLKQELGAQLAKKLNPLFKIYDLVPAEQLPRTASGKLMRRKLRARYLEG